MADSGSLDASGNGSLQALFAQLRANQEKGAQHQAHSSAPSHGQQYHPSSFAPQPSFQASAQPHGYHQPSVSSTIISPPIHGSQPHHSSIMSPNVPSPASNTPAPPPGHANMDRSDRTANLLNLLRFHQPPTPMTGAASTNEIGQRAEEDTHRPAYAAVQNQPGQNDQSHQRTISASDLVASFMGKPSASPAQKNAPTSVSQGRPEPFRVKSESPTAENPQDFLLRLLNRPKPTPNEGYFRQDTAESQRIPAAAVNDLKQDLADASAEKSSGAPGHGPAETATSKSPRVHPVGHQQENVQPVASESASGAKQNSIFTYVNPFEQLAASSPRNRTPKPADRISAQVDPNVEALNPSQDPAVVANHEKRSKSRESSRGPKTIISRKQMVSNGHKEAPGLVSPPPTLPDGRSQLEALLGIGAENKKTPETVSEALTEVGEKVDKQVEEALAEAERGLGAREKREAGSSGEEEPSKTGRSEVEENIHRAAIDVKMELEKAENTGVLEESLPTSAAEVVKDIIEEAADDNVADSWESASATKEDLDRKIRVLNFPMKPFVSITIKPEHDYASELRQDAIMDIARLKKGFDQIDRTLATATNRYIVYAMSKNGGFRIIRQDDGKDRQIFRTPQDRIFNVAISVAPSGSLSAGTETVLGTGVSGSVYWSTISKPSEDLFEEDEIESQGIIFPPSPAQDENTSGGQLKTRAKKSSRHPEVIAIGRGKSIHLIYPEVARSSYRENSKTKIVDSEKYLKERTLKIAAGKAGKDFTFSEDDSLIASLDKAGRLRFWDIRPLLDTGAGAVAALELPPVELKTPLMTLITTPPSEKSWPTSVLFVDKHRPFVKGIALRYMIIGLKQNHTLQLWDLGLGKVVQELNFPHEKEQDAICSVSYHPSSGIISVGHPTRNSIYLVHLSAPKYNLAPMSQAQYVQRLVQKSSSLQKPEATAIMSGLRELSFASKGELRSVDMLCTPSTPVDGADRDDPVLFELYAVHSKGVTCLNIKREDLGWSKDSKVLHPVDAQAEGFISINELVELPPMIPGDSNATSTGGQSAVSTQRVPSSLRPAPKELARKDTSTGSRSNPPQTAEAAMIASTLAKVEDQQDAARAAIVNGAGMNGTDKADKKKKKRTAEAEASKSASNESTISGQISIPPSSYAHAAQRAKSPQSDVQQPSKNYTRQQASKLGLADSQETSLSKSNGIEQSKSVHKEAKDSTTTRLIDADLTKVEEVVSKEVSRVIGRELDSLYRRFDDDRRAQDAAGAARHEAVLRLVSSTLSENVERNLARMIQANIQQVVLPSINEVLASTLDAKIPDLITRDLKAAFPEALDRALQSQTIQNIIADKITAHVERNVSKMLHDSVSPAFKNLTFNAAQKFSGEVNRRVSDEVGQRVSEVVGQLKDQVGQRVSEEVDRRVREQLHQVDHRVGEQLHQAELQRFDASTKIEQLKNLVQSLSETVQIMASTQSTLQNEIVKLQEQVAGISQVDRDQKHSRQGSQLSSAQAEVPLSKKTPEDEEIEKVAGLLEAGNYEDATICWLQSSHQDDLFSRLFVRCNPAYLRVVSGLVALSVSAAVTSSLDSHLTERLTWLETIFGTIDPSDPDIHEIAPQIMDIISQRLEGLYMLIAESNPHDPVLRKIPPLTRRARELKSKSAVR